MSKVKSDQIPHYELLCLIANKFTEDEVKPIIEKVKKSIVDLDGVITNSEEWGKKRLAYPINGDYFGYYNVIEFDLAGENLTKIERALRMSAEILRHQVVRIKKKTAEEIEKDKKIAEKIAARVVEEEKVAVEEEKAKEKDKDKIDLKDLDDKLDKILDTDSLL